MDKQTLTEIDASGTLKSSRKLTGLMVAFVAVGVAVFVVGLLVDRQRAWSNFLIGYFFFLCLGLGGLVFTAIQHASGAAWSTSIRRLAEGMFSFLPVAVGLAAIMLLGLTTLYEWTTHTPHEHLTQGKVIYLSAPMFTLRQALFLGLWILFGALIVRNSVRQDQTRDAVLTRANKKLSLAFLVIFAFTFTFASMDLLMSLEEHWYSTIFGVYCFSGLFLSGMAALAILVILLRRAGYLQGAVTEIHLRDLGTWIMAFSVFMVYIGFSQYMLIWYANLSLEISYMARRTQHGWQYVTMLLPLLKWIVPFIVLMPAKFRANEKVILLVCVGILLGQYLDIYWMVVPVFSATFRMIGWMEVGVFLGFLGIFGLALLRFYRRHALVASGDPALESCVTGRYLHV